MQVGSYCLTGDCRLHLWRWVARQREGARAKFVAAVCSRFQSRGSKDLQSTVLNLEPLCDQSPDPVPDPGPSLSHPPAPPPAPPSQLILQVSTMDLLRFSQLQVSHCTGPSHNGGTLHCPPFLVRPLFLVSPLPSRAR